MRKCVEWRLLRYNVGARALSSRCVSIPLKIKHHAPEYAGEVPQEGGRRGAGGESARQPGYRRRQFTSVRSLESAAQAAKATDEPFFGVLRKSLFIRVINKVIDALITNFQSAESTLIMLVSAFAGYQHRRMPIRLR